MENIELKEQELIDALEFYNITANNFEKAKDIQWLTQENAKFFLVKDKRESANRYFSVIKGRQHKLDIVKPYIKDGLNGLGYKTNATTIKRRAAASTSKITDSDYVLYDALMFYDIEYENLDRARDMVWLKRKYAKTTLSLHDKEEGLHSFNVIKANQGKLKTFKRKFVLIDNETNNYESTHKPRPRYEEPYGTPFEQPTHSRASEQTSIHAFREQVKEGIIRNGHKSGGQRIDDTIENVIDKNRRYGYNNQAQEKNTNINNRANKESWYSVQADKPKKSVGGQVLKAIGLIILIALGIQIIVSILF